MGLVREMRENTIREVIDALEVKLHETDIAIEAVTRVQMELEEFVECQTDESRESRDYMWRGIGLHRGLQVCTDLQRSIGKLIDELREDIDDDCE